jgi:hypothetical protein
MTSGGTGGVYYDYYSNPFYAPSGGAPGQPGGGTTPAGGSSGSAVNGNSFITWATVGDRRGPLN